MTATNIDTSFYFLIGFISLVVLIVILIFIFKSPFKYPYFDYDFDVSGKRKPKIEDLIDEFLIAGNFDNISGHFDVIQNWKKDCNEIIENSRIKKYRMNQFQECLDDKHAFKFHIKRKHTRYKQVNYIKTPYTVIQEDGCYEFDYTYLKNRNEQLKEINYECTISKYNNQNQRKLMTKELRKKIIIRDNYTCQICGKYMPDEVGLQIDHIKSIAKGGKTVESNLQVLCSKCNGKKSDKEDF